MCIRLFLICIGIIFEGKEMGLATGAEFLLARTEKANSEPFSEEEYWMEAMEWADKNGAHIISSSLAYTYHRYFPNEMNGKNSFVAKAAKIAASKGILVVNAAGNDGTADWKIIATPADVDSVLTVGGISPYSDYHISFSSYGPTADKRMKPNVCAFGQVVAASGKDKLKQAYGTSFATPLVAGFAACALQASEYKLKNMELFSEIEKSAHLYPYFDYAHGYGVPQASHFLKLPKNNLATFVIKKESYSIKINILPDFLPAKKDTFDTTDDAVVFDDENSKNYLYYHIQNKEGWIDYYCVIEVKQADVADIDIEKLVSGQKIMINYKGYTETFTKE
jgi:serine protease AprX